MIFSKAFQRNMFFSQLRISEQMGEHTKTLLEMFHEKGCDEKTSTIMSLDMLFAGRILNKNWAGFLETNCLLKRIFK